MSIRAIKWAFSLKLPTTAKFVLVALAEHADDDGECWPLQTRIAEMTGLSDRAVRYVIYGLKASGLLKSSGGKGRASVFFLALEITEIDAEMSEIIVRECASTSKKQPAPGQGSRHQIPKNRNQIPMPNRNQIPIDRNDIPIDRNDIPNHRTTKNHQEPPVPPKAPPRPDADSGGGEMAVVAAAVAAVVPPEIPGWMPMDAWNGFLEMRRKKKKPPTERAVRLIVADLLRFRAAGHDVEAILDTSTKAGWTGVFEPKVAARSERKPQSALAQQFERMQRQYGGAVG